MSKDHLKNFGIFFFLSLLCITAFLSRLENFKNSESHTTDEVLYFQVGRQLKMTNFKVYNSIPIAERWKNEGDEMPAYMFKPLFKHPPLYPSLIALSLTLLGETPISAYLVTLILGVLMIPLTYFLGTFFFNRSVGLVSAFILFIDPVSIMCSQKVWMDPCLAFLTVLSILLFAVAIKNGNRKLLILGGFVCGCATLMKYPGILPLFAFIAYATVYQQRLFKSAAFYIASSLPFIMLMPWIIWNHVVYGAGFFRSQLQNHELSFSAIMRILVILFIAMMVLGVLLKRYAKQAGSARRLAAGHKIKNAVLWSAMVILFYYLRVFLKFSLSMVHLPAMSWKKGFFEGVMPGFYLGRLFEFSPFYILAVIAFFVPTGKADPIKNFLKMQVLVILVFFTYIGNFQSRYILAVIPLLIVFGVDLLVRIYQACSQDRRFFIRMAGKFGLAMFVVFFLWKMMLINYLLSFTNDMCYF